MIDEWVLARFIGYLGGAVAFWFFTRRGEPRDAAPCHGFRRRVVRSAVRPPADDAARQDADAPHRAAQSDEQVNRFHAVRIGG